MAAIATLLALVPGAVSSPAAADEVYGTPAGGSWTVSGAGFGHGIGMSQWGAQGAALQGLSSDQIVGFYYPGTNLVSLGNPTIRVQLTANAGASIVFGAYAGEQLTATDASNGHSEALPAASRYLLTIDASAMHVSVLTAGNQWAQIQFGGSPNITGPLDVGGPSGFWTYSPDLSGAGRQYWGTLRLLRTSATTAQAVNFLAMEAYTKFVVPREMPSGFATSALRAQAIAARSYARSVSTPSGPWDICDTTQCQVYGGRATADAGTGKVTFIEAASTSAAVDATSGLVPTDGNGAPAFTQFSSSNGGYSVAGSKPYLVAKADPYSGVAPGDTVSRWQAQLPISALQARCASGETVTSASLVRDGRGPFGGRITSALLSCSGRAVTVTGPDSLRFGLRSNMWQPSNFAFGNIESIGSNSGGVHVSGWAIDPTTSPASITISVGSQGFTFDADGNRPDVAQAHPPSGPAVGFDVTVPAAGGRSTVCVDTGSAATRARLGCAIVDVPPGGPYGHVDQVRGVPGSGGTPPGVIAAGWAIDPNTTAPIDVHLYGATFAVPVTANGERPDIGRALPGAGSAHGFSTRIAAPAGALGKLCAFAINVPTPQANPVIGCARYRVPGGPPIGNVEIVSSNAGGAIVAGWAIDPDKTDSSQVRFTVDGNRTFVIAANQSRPDVANVYPDYGSAHGFSVVLPTGSGQHTVCVDLVNIGLGTNTPFPCTPMSVPDGAPIGSLESVTSGSGALAITGWAIDPPNTEPISVILAIDGALRVVTANQPRPDIDNAHPNHGFALNVPTGPGVHSVCAYAVNGPGTLPNPWLGCTTLTV
jgi:SpoIID/LytB domain protein